MPHRLLAVAALLIPISNPPAAASDEPVLGVLDVDAIEYVVGREVPGREEFAVVHGNFEYRFASDDNREAFLANPERYKIQLGGACARMGPLSGHGRPELRTVHDGRIFIFASESCRQTFKRDPAKVLEPAVDIPPVVTTAAGEHGRALVERAVTWMGGASKLDRVDRCQVMKDELVDWRGDDVRSAKILTIGRDGSFRNATIWGEEVWVKTLGPDGGFFDDPDGVRTLRPAQRRALERQRDQQLFSILQARQRPDFVAIAAKGPGSNVVTVHFGGTTNTLHIDSDTGEILAHGYWGRGSHAFLGDILRTYTEWQSVDGLRMPVAWTVSVDGARVEDLDASGYVVTLAYDANPSVFAPSE